MANYRYPNQRSITLPLAVVELLGPDPKKRVREIIVEHLGLDEWPSKTGPKTTPHLTAKQYQQVGELVLSGMAPTDALAKVLKQSKPPKASKASRGGRTAAAYTFQNSNYGVITATVPEMVRKYGLDSGGLSRVVTGQRPHHKGWELVKRRRG